MSRILRIRPQATADIDRAAAALFDENPTAARSFLHAVEVLRVLHGARDIPAILLDETDLT